MKNATICHDELEPFVFSQQLGDLIKKRTILKLLNWSKLEEQCRLVADYWPTMTLIQRKTSTCCDANIQQRPFNQNFKKKENVHNNFHVIRFEPCEMRLSGTPRWFAIFSRTLIMSGPWWNLSISTRADVFLSTSCTSLAHWE